MGSSVDLTSLPDVIFADADAAGVEQAVVSVYEAITGRTLYAGDPVRLFLEAMAAIIAQQRAVIDNAGKMNLLRYALGGYLDHQGVLTGVTRIAATAAQCTCRFSVSEALEFAVTIPAGTRVATADGTAEFATTAAATLAAGALYVDVTAQASATGAALNGLLPGQISQIVDAVDYVDTVANTDTTAGGADQEDDDSLRARIQLSPESFSTAGPELAYVYWAKTASALISDVAVEGPEATPGVVDVRVLCKGGALPSAEILALVTAALSAEKVRPLTDKVQVSAPTVVSYDIALTYYIRQSDSALAAQIQTAVASAIADFSAWQCAAIGRDVNPSELVKRVVAAGAKRCVVTSPSFADVGKTEVAQLGTSTVTYGGLEAD